MKEVGQHCADCEYKAQYIQPQGRVNFPVEVFPQAELQKQRGQADRRDHQKRKWTQQCASPGVENDKCESKKKQPKKPKKNSKTDKTDKPAVPGSNQ